jgi:hypothetical protein
VAPPALWQQPGSPCEVTRACGTKTALLPPCLPLRVPASSTPDLERPAPLRADAYIPGRTLSRSPPSQPSPGPSSAARAFPAAASGSSTRTQKCLVSRRTPTPPPPPGSQLAARVCPAAVLGPYYRPPHLRTSSALHPSSDRLHIRTLPPSPSGRLPPCSRPTARASPAATLGALAFEPRVQIFRRTPLAPHRLRTLCGHTGACSPMPWGHHTAWCRTSCGRLPCSRSSLLNSGPRVPCTLRAIACTSRRFHHRRRVGCRLARG